MAKGNQYYSSDRKRKQIMQRNYNQFDTISRLLNGLKRDIERYGGVYGFNSIAECAQRPVDIIRMLTEMRDKVNVPQNQVYQSIQTQGVQQQQPIINYGQQPQLQNCVPSFNSYAQNISYNNNCVMTRFMY